MFATRTVSIALVAAIGTTLTVGAAFAGDPGSFEEGPDPVTRYRNLAPEIGYDSPNRFDRGESVDEGFADPRPRYDEEADLYEEDLSEPLRRRRHSYDEHDRDGFVRRRVERTVTEKITTYRRPGQRLERPIVRRRLPAHFEGARAIDVPYEVVRPFHARHGVHKRWRRHPGWREHPAWRDRGRGVVRIVERPCRTRIVRRTPYGKVVKIIEHCRDGGRHHRHHRRHPRY